MKEWSVGVDVGGTYIKFACVDASGRLLEFHKIKTPVDSERAVMMDHIVDGIRHCAKIMKREVQDVGIGVPGCVDFDKGFIHTLVNIPGWDDVPLADILKEKLGCRVFVDNDVNVMALGELHFGAAKKGRNVIALTLGTGVGGALIIDTRLYRGSSTTAGEIGHMVVEKDGFPCNCGSWGCLERYVGNKYLVEQVEEAKDDFPNSILFHDDTLVITPIEIEKAALKGDTLAMSIWEIAGTYLGIVIAGLVNFVNPDIIVIGGGVALAGDLILNPVRREIASRSMKRPREAVQVLPAELGENAGVIGAATLAMIS
ncbi:MAG: ROK family protein [Chlamydiota bacterium]|nr:ROK family protein [Chlamydiota bacterium]